MSNKPRRLYECGPFTVDPQNRVLARGGEAIPLPPKAFETLLVLVQHRGDLLEKERLLKEVWPSTFVEENNLTQYISLLRKVLGDKAGHQHYIETVPKLGYRFVAAVREVEPDDGTMVVARRVRAQVVVSNEQGPTIAASTSEVLPVTTPATLIATQSEKRMWLIGTALLALAVLVFAGYRLLSGGPQVPQAPAPIQKRRSVAVLGFKNLGGNPQADWLSPALAEMLTTELSAGGQLRTVPGEDVARTRTDLKISESNTLSKATLARVLKNLGADVTISGSYLELTTGADGQIRLDIQVQDTADGETVGSIAEVGTASQLFELVSRTGTQLRAKLGVSQKSGAEEGEIRAALPASPEAARFYSQGLAKLRAFDAVTAQQFLTQAVASDPKFALGHSALAAAWAALGYDENARKEAGRALALSDELSRQDHLLIAGRFWEMNRNWDKAVEAYQLLFNSYPDNLDYGLRLASAQTSGGNGRDALNTVATLRNLGAPQNEDPQIDLAEALAAESLGDFKHELQSAQAASRKGDLLGENLVVARARSKEAWALSRLGDPVHAVEALRQARDLFSSAGDRQGMASTLQIAATILAGKGDYRSAKQDVNEALQTFQQLGDKRGAAQSLNLLAMIHYEQGELSEAQSLFEQALQINREVGSRINTAGALGNIANVLEAKGDLAAAQKLTEESIKVFSEVGDERARGTALGNLASLLFAQGDLAGARTTYEHALDIKRRIGYQRGIAYDLAGLSEVLEAQADLANARKSQEEALSIRKRIGEKHNAAVSVLVLAQISLDQNLPADAETLARDAIAQFKSDKSSADESLAEIIFARALIAQGKLADAENAISRAAALSRSTDNRPLRFELVAASAYVEAAGRRSHARDSDQALRQRLQAAVADARRCGYRAYEFKLVLANAEFDRSHGETAATTSMLQSLIQEAKSRGFVLVAQQAENVLSRKSP